MPGSVTPEVAGAIRRSWAFDTALDNAWWPEQPSRGQCAVTALVIQELVGGELLRAVTSGVSHYWNRLPDGTEVDLTRDQFDVFDPGDVQVRTREYALSYAATADRYEILRERVHKVLASEGRVDGETVKH
jgi:hypothetical protein